MRKLVVIFRKELPITISSSSCLLLQKFSTCLLVQLTPLLSARLEPPNNAAGIAEVILVRAGAGGKAGQRVERVEICADVIHLRRANGEVAREADVDAAAKSHGKCVGAIQRSRYASQDRHTYTCAHAGERRAEQSVSKD